MGVTRCVCNCVTFQELIDLAQRLDPQRELSEDDLIEALAARTRCATGCGTCRPYIRVALRTGKASLPVMSTSQIRGVESSAERK